MEGRKVLANNVIATRGQAESSRCVALDEYLELQRDTRESRNGFEAIVGPAQRFVRY